MRKAGALASIALLALAGCRTAAPAPPPMTFAEAGLQPARVQAAPKDSSRLAAATRELLDAIEHETGLRPAVDEDDGEQPPPGREVRRKADGWTAERSALAMELLRALDTGEATVRSVQRAQAALRWDLAVGARWTEVDQQLVFRALRAAEAALPQAPPPAAPQVEDVGDGLEWPVDPVRITSAFGIRSDPFGEGARRHLGIDLAAFQGQPVLCAARGTVVFAGLRGGYGLHVEVRHPGGIVTRYAHLSGIDVQVGDRVSGGALLGRAGQSGRATGPHLHFELWREGLPVDPADELPRIVIGRGKMPQAVLRR